MASYETVERAFIIASRDQHLDDREHCRLLAVLCAMPEDKLNRIPLNRGHAGLVQFLTTYAAQTGLIMAAVHEAATRAALAVLEAQAAPPKPKSFSSVGNTEAFQFLRDDLKIVHVDGNEIYPEELQLPDRPCACADFDMSPYPNETAATGPMLAHHQVQLTSLGVPFGRGGFHIYNVRNLTDESLLIQHGKKAFRGIFDGCIAPYGVSLASAMGQCRVVYEHKVPQELDNGKGQAVLELLAACAYGPCPVLLDLTDGKKHHVYTIRGPELIAWTELTPTQAYNLQARHLMSDSSRTMRALKLEQIPKEEQAWMRPLHQLRPESGLHEQLESVIPFLQPEERMPAALELIHAWGQAQQPVPPMPLTASIQASYASGSMADGGGALEFSSSCAAAPSGL